MRVGIVLGEVVRALEAELEGGDQRLRGKSQDAGQHLLREGNVKSQRRARDDGAGRAETEQGNLSKNLLVKTAPIPNGLRR